MIKDFKIIIIEKKDFGIYKKDIINIHDENAIANGGTLVPTVHIDDADNILIAKLGKNIVGYLSLSTLDKKEIDLGVASYDIKLNWESNYYIKQLAVSKKMQNKGAGSALLDFLKEYARNNSIKTLYLWTASSNTKAQHFYDKNKFEKHGDWIGIPKDMPGKTHYYLYSFDL